MYQSSATPISQNLQAALNVCSDMTIEEIFELMNVVTDKKEDIQCRDEWITAIVATLERRCPRERNLN